jgi:hypothetical protein
MEYAAIKLIVSRNRRQRRDFRVFPDQGHARSKGPVRRALIGKAAMADSHDFGLNAFGSSATSRGGGGRSGRGVEMGAPSRKPTA